MFWLLVFYCVAAVVENN